MDYEDSKKEPDTKKPDKFSHIKWLFWEETVYTYFTDKKTAEEYPSHTLYARPHLHQEYS